MCVWPRCSATAEVREGGGGGEGRASRDHWKGGGGRSAKAGSEEMN